MVVHAIRGGEVDSRVKKHGGLAVVDWHAVWCGPCKALAPQLERLSAEHPDVAFFKVEEKEADGEVQARAIRGFPTLHFFVKGSKVDEVVGADVNAIVAKIAKHKAAVPSSFSGAGQSLGGGGGAGGGVGASAEAMRAARLARLGAAPTTAAAGAGGGSGSASAASAAPASPSPAAGGDDAAAAARARALAAAAGAMVADEEKLAMMVSMDFPRERAERALLAVRNAGVEEAVDWLASHGDGVDADGDAVMGGGGSAAAAASSRASAAAVAGAGAGTGPDGSVSAEDRAAIQAAEAEMAASGATNDDGSSKKKLTVEEVQQLLAKRRAEKAETAKVEAREREIKRREDGKKAIDMAEELQDIARKREYEKRRMEKEAQTKERERIRLEMLRDKADRIAEKTGLVPPELAAEILALATGGKKPVPMTDAKSVMAATVKQMSAQKSADAGLTCAKTVRVLCQNVLEHPGEAKYRSVNLANEKIKERICGVTGGLAFMKAAGWQKDDAANTLTMDDAHRDEGVLRTALAEVDAAIAAGAFK